MEKMLKNLRKKTYSQLWIVVAFVALFALTHQGVYADMMDNSGGQDASFSVPVATYGDTFDAYDTSVDSNSYSFDNSYSYDFAPAAEAPNYVVDWNDSAATADWNASNPTKAGYNDAVSASVTSPQAIYGDMHNLYNTPTEISVGLQPDFGDTPATYGEYGEFFEGGYSTIPSDAVMSSGADFPYG